MKILATNPAIYQRFRDGLVENFYTHWGVSYSLHRFLDNDLRIPELREEIMAHPLNRSRSAGGLFAYLTGETSPQTAKKQVRSSSVSPISKKSTQTPSNPLLDSLSLPNLEKTDHSEDDSDGIVFYEGLFTS